MKMALIKPLLKKSSLCLDHLPNYWQVSNLSFLSKLVERAAVKQLTAHLEFFLPLRSGAICLLATSFPRNGTPSGCQTHPLMLVMLRFSRC
jgi:hypothetical protein